MIIVVPSIGRAGKSNSMKWLPEAGRSILFAVHEDEAAAYRKAYPNTSVMVLSEHCRKHTGLVRKEIMSAIRDPFFFVDDDIRINLRAVTSVKEAFDIIERHLNSGFSMAGLGQQLFATYSENSSVIRNDDPFAVLNKFVATVYAIRPTDFDDCPLEHLPVYEDVALVIHAIERGGGTVATYVATHANVSPPEGGCNSWRDKDITIKSLQKLVELYPHVCSIRETYNTTHNQYIGIGLKTQWSKIKKLDL